MRIGVPPLTLVFLLLGLPWVAQATVFHEKSVAERAAEADLVVVGRVLSSMTTGRVVSGLETHTSVEVSAYWKGSGPPLLEVVQTGGSSGPWEAFLVGDAKFQIEENVLLFLRCQFGQGAPRCRLLGLEAGKARIDGDWAVVFHPSQGRYSRERLETVRAWIGSSVNVATSSGAYLSSKSLNSHRFLDFKMLSNDEQPFPCFIDGRNSAPGGMPLSKFVSESEQAWKTWDNVSCSATAFQSQGVTTSQVVEPRDPFDKHSVSSLWIDSRDDSFYRTVLVGSEVTAVSLMLVYSGVLQQCDIYLNAADRIFSVEATTPEGAVDLQTVILHEVGHCQGLAHSEVSAPQAEQDIMYPVVPMGSSKRQLSLGEQQLLCERYPAFGAMGAPCFPDGGCSEGLSCELAPSAEPNARVRMCTYGCDLDAASTCEPPYVCAASSAFAPIHLGACFPPIGFVTPIGKSCENSMACETSNGECLLQGPLSSSWEAGYCTQRCGNVQPPCPVGSICVSDAADAFCLKSCRVGMADCRPGYACAPDVTGTMGTCQPACSASQGCKVGECRVCDGVCLFSRRPTATVGEPCSVTEECGLGQVCGRFSDAGLGVCTLPCDSACASCLEGSRCHVLGPQGERFCLRDCDVGTCPTGLRCGWTSNGKGCLPPCLVDEECPVGQTCQSGECRRPSDNPKNDPSAAVAEPKANGCSCGQVGGGEAALVGWFGGVLWAYRKRHARAV